MSRILRDIPLLSEMSFQSARTSNEPEAKTRPAGNAQAAASVPFLRAELLSIYGVGPAACGVAKWTLQKRAVALTVAYAL